jgi:hypothetical protein
MHIDVNSYTTCERFVIQHQAVKNKKGPPSFAICAQGTILLGAATVKTRLKILPVLTREHYTSLLHWV